VFLAFFHALNIGVFFNGWLGRRFGLLLIVVVDSSDDLTIGLEDLSTVRSVD